MQIGVILREHTLRRLGVAENGGEGLVQFMREGAR